MRCNSGRGAGLIRAHGVLTADARAAVLRAYRPAWAAGAVLLLLPLVAVAFLVRIVAVALLRRRWPRVASAVKRWWSWLPLAAVLVAVTAARPVIGVLASVVTVVLTRTSSVGSPFRPR
jgi:hypothetical protein